MKYIFSLFIVLIYLNGFAQTPLPIDFEGSSFLTTDWVENFGGGVGTGQVTNPSYSIRNMSDQVGRIVKNAPEVWAGARISTGVNFNFTTNRYICMKGIIYMEISQGYYLYGNTSGMLYITQLDVCDMNLLS